MGVFAFCVARVCGLFEAAKAFVDLGRGDLLDKFFVVDAASLLAEVFECFCVGFNWRGDVFRGLWTKGSFRVVLG